MIPGSSLTGLTWTTASDLLTLIKPRITALVVFTTAAGLWFAPVRPSAPIIFYSLLGTVILVGAANALNMYLERHTDALMKRTQNRPLPAHRLKPRIALILGILLMAVALPMLYLRVNPLTAALGFVAFVSYVLFYTPLKQRSHVALLVGAVPGAMPPLMGWTAATDFIGMPGLVLFFILFLWQIPHFLAIALWHQGEYEKAGIRILPLEKGERETKHWLIRYLAGLIAVSYYPVWLGLTGPSYFWVASFLGAVFFGLGLRGLKEKPSTPPSSPWAFQFFLMSILYLPLLLIALVASKK